MSGHHRGLMVPSLRAHHTVSLSLTGSEPPDKERQDEIVILAPASSLVKQDLRSWLHSEAIGKEDVLFPALCLSEPLDPERGNTAGWTPHISRALPQHLRVSKSSRSCSPLSESKCDQRLPQRPTHTFAFTTFFNFRNLKNKPTEAYF